MVIRSTCSERPKPSVMLIYGAALAVAVSVVMHVTWNLIARHQARDAYPLWWVLLAHLVLLGPWGV